MEKKPNILVTDDDANLCDNLKDILEEDGYQIVIAANISEAKEKLIGKFYNLALIDLRLPDGTGLELLKLIKKMNKETMVVVFTGFASLESSVAALNEGVFAYIQKPVHIDELKIIIKKALKMQKLSLANKRLLKTLKNLSLKDHLTGLYNYRYFMERMQAEFNRAKRYVLPLSVLLFDVDYFKSINDVYGHQYGDLILKEIAQVLLNSARESDVVIRYGGEEFVIILPDTEKEGAARFGFNLQGKFKTHVFDPHDKRIKIKISMGIASYPDRDINSEHELMNSVDKALLEAKEMGSNRVVIFKDKAAKSTRKTSSEAPVDNVVELNEKLNKMSNRVNKTLLEAIFAFAKTIEARDYYTGEHGENMVSIAVEIGKRLNLSNIALEDLERAAILHDLGKVGIPDNILHKKGKLTKKEYEKIKQHPSIGAEIIRNIHFLSRVVPIVLYHHERFDGLGYSSGMKGKGIPLGARIIAVADVYQALISNRPYRKAYAKEEAQEIVKEGAGTHFDPEVVKVFLSIMNKEGM